MTDNAKSNTPLVIWHHSLSLVVRLRNAHTTQGDLLEVALHHEELCDEAADEIETLVKILECVREAYLWIETKQPPEQRADDRINAALSALNTSGERATRS